MCLNVKKAWFVQGVQLTLIAIAAFQNFVVIEGW